MNKFTITALLLAGSATLVKADALFDATNFSDFYIINYNETGELFSLSASNATITDTQVQYYVPGPSDYNDLQLSETFFGTGQTTFTDSGNELSDPLETVVYDFGAQSNLSGIFQQTINLTTPLTLSGNLLGIQFTWLDVVNGQATAADGVYNLFSLDNTQTPAVGSNALRVGGTDMFELYANATDSSTPLSQVGNIYQEGGFTNEDLSVVIDGTPAPEPSSFAFLGLGALGLIATSRRRRNRKS